MLQIPKSHPKFYELLLLALLILLIGTSSNIHAQSFGATVPSQTMQEVEDILDTEIPSEDMLEQSTDGSASPSNEANKEEDIATDKVEANDSHSSVSEEEENYDVEVEPLPEISYDLQALPFPTRRMHELMLEATKTGDIEKLRAIVGSGENMTLLSLGGVDGDPIDFLKEQSGDESGHEILAILEEVLESGYVHLDAGTDRELFVWPYFFAYPINKLSDRQMVELFRLVTFGDFQDMQDFGGYIFYRVGITPTGRWQFFVAGD